MKQYSTKAPEKETKKWERGMDRQRILTHSKLVRFSVFRPQQPSAASGRPSAPANTRRYVMAWYVNVGRRGTYRCRYATVHTPTANTPAPANCIINIVTYYKTKEEMTSYLAGSLEN